ncbi:YadA C-terminal domain-containing protein [Acinetobacter sp. YH12039]|uniref:YadA C-terminal domain-containing protein n=1 Tax=Acinetobacter sp. YH12039 TaxID=2601047 RepID=UPI00211E050C|nr:YadA C-terminal domain-containing protein [Acinetobacter sp. YH12039]
MKFQKTLLAASLALATVGANASGENPFIDPVHHAISKSDANVGNYAKVWFNTNTNQIDLGTPGDYTTVTVNNTAPGANVRSVDALDYLYEQLKTYNGAALQSATNADKLDELNAIYTALGGTSANGVLDFFAQASGQPAGNNGAFLAQHFVTHAVPNLDIYADGAVSGVNAYNNVNNANQNIVSPVYGRDNVISLQAFGGPNSPVANGVDLNSRKAIIESSTAKADKLQLVKYGTGAGAVYQFFSENANIASDAALFNGQYYREDVNGQLVKTTLAQEVNRDTITKAGQYTISKTGSGEEIKLITDEHLTYGFKSTQNVAGIGTITDPNAADPETFNSVQGVTGQAKSKYDYVNVGVVGNTNTDHTVITDPNDPRYDARLIPGNAAYDEVFAADHWRADHYANPAQSIYGVSAERTDNNGVRNIATLTGYGLSLSNLGTDANPGTLNFDGSVTRLQSGAAVGLPLQTQYYENLNGQNIVKVTDTAAGTTEYYTTSGAPGTANNTMTRVTDEAQITALAAATAGKDATLTGTTRKVVGAAPVTEHNVVTNVMTQYYTETADKGASTLQSAVTDPTGGALTTFNTATSSGAGVNVSYVQLGDIGNSVHGIRVYNGTKGSTTDGQYTNLTAAGIVTNGVVDAKTFKVDGKDVTEFLKTGVAPEPTNPTDPTDPTNPTNPGAGGVTETVVDTKVEAKAKVTLEAANAYTDTKVDGAIKTASADMTKAATEAATTAANNAVDSKLDTTSKAANAYTDKAVATVNSRVNQLNSRVDDVERTANRGVAIALAAQQAVPNIAPGQVAVFGGVGHYEGETAGSIGVVTSFTDRISASGALGFASGSEFGGRVGVSYVFGGK